MIFFCNFDSNFDGTHLVLVGKLVA